MDFSTASYWAGSYSIAGVEDVADLAYDVLIIVAVVAALWSTDDPVDVRGRIEVR